MSKFRYFIWCARVQWLGWKYGLGWVLSDDPQMMRESFDDELWPSDYLSEAYRDW